MLALYRLHKKNCRRAARRLDRSVKTCSCPIHVEGKVGVDFVRVSLKTTNWQLANSTVQDAEARGSWAPPQAKGPAPVTLAHALDEWVCDAEARDLAKGTLKKYYAERKRLKASELFRLDELDVARLRRYRNSWNDKPLSASKRIERLRGFFKFCMEAGWVKVNPAMRVKMPEVQDKPTLPFDADEMERIYKAIEDYPKKETYPNTFRHRKKIWTLVRLLECSGLRIGDAVSLSVDRVKGGRLHLNTQKTKVHVMLPLPDDLTNALAGTELYSGKYYFWTGKGEVTSCTNNWRDTLREIFLSAKVPHGHPHRFRDTFAVNLLLSGVPLERVSKLLGHKSIRVTEKHYAPWVQELQNQLEADVKRSRSWKNRGLKMVKKKA